MNEHLLTVMVLRQMGVQTFIFIVAEPLVVRNKIFNNLRYNNYIKRVSS